MSKNYDPRAVAVYPAPDRSFDEIFATVRNFKNGAASREVRSGSLSDFSWHSRDVRSAPMSGHRQRYR
jgi:hypothetical protein